MLSQDGVPRLASGDSAGILGFFVNIGRRSRAFADDAGGCTCVLSQEVRMRLSGRRTHESLVFGFDDAVEFVLPFDREAVIVNDVDGPFPNRLEIVGRNKNRVVDRCRRLFSDDPVITGQSTTLFHEERGDDRQQIQSAKHGRK